MKKLIVAIVMIIFTTPVFAQNGIVKINITGIENTNGSIVIGLYNTKSSFPVVGKQFKGMKIKPSKTGVNCVFENLPNGTYAIAAWHDENGNQKVDKNMIGTPKEKYGFSKNIYGTFGPPDFKNVSFKVLNGKIIKLTINLK